jgi:hypothetical protein
VNENRIIPDLMNMKKLIVALVASTLALALNASAQQDDQQQQEKKHKKAHAEQGEGQNASEHPAQHPHAGGQAQTQQAPKSKPKNPSGQHQPKTEGSPQTTAAKKGHHMQQEGQPAKTQQVAPEAGPAKATGETQATAKNAPTAQKNPERKRTADAKKPDVATIKSKNANFHAQPKPDTVKSVTFVQNRTIVGAQNWYGPQYVAFRNYHPVMHDRGWYSGRYNRIVLIGGGYYYLNAGYWYPAWGYAPTQQYYAYDGPIYAGRAAVPPDQVIANVQSSLQEMGYYTGEVDGLLGPLTQEALNGYQADNDLTVTGAIDEPTLSSLNLS